MPSHKKRSPKRRSPKYTVYKSKSRRNYAPQDPGCRDCTGPYGEYYEDRADEMIECPDRCLTKEQRENRRRRDISFGRQKESSCSIQ